MHQPKWFKNDRDIKVGDVVIFLKQEDTLSQRYQYGMITTVNVGKDGKIRQVEVKYRNHNESVDRLTSRAVRELLMIHQVDETNLIQELGEIETLLHTN